MTIPQYPTQQRPSYEVEVRERLTRLEMAERYAQKLQQDQANSLNRIGTNVLINSRTLGSVQYRVSKLDMVPEQIKNIVRRLDSQARTIVVLRGTLNVALGALILWMIYIATMTEATVAGTVKSWLGIVG